MSVNLSFEWEGKNGRKMTVEGKSIFDFILSHKDYPLLSEHLRQTMEKQPKEIQPYILLSLEVEGKDWSPYRPATLEEPEEEGGCSDCELLNYDMDGDDSIMDSILFVYPMANSEDYKILKSMFSEKVLIPSFLPGDMEFFENISVSPTGEYILNFYGSDLESTFQDYLTDQDWKEINSCPPEALEDWSSVEDRQEWEEENREYFQRELEAEDWE